MPIKSKDLPLSAAQQEARDQRHRRSEVASMVASAGVGSKKPSQLTAQDRNAIVELLAVQFGIVLPENDTP